MARPGTISSTRAVEVSIQAVAPASTGGCSGSGAAFVVADPEDDRDHQDGQQRHHGHDDLVAGRWLGA